ncbi:MAG: hypothetical protein HRU38_20915, partial [Saccharospirillaceae bacterium]|nr:hypothetical protein [Pseudomonadales bacterium]NRB81094.1 hypothetical protein [Saccharospirillaceae bacterium]
MLVRSPKGRNNPTAFIHNTSVFDIRIALPSQVYLSIVEGLRVYTVAASLVFCSKNHFIDKPLAMRAMLSMVADASDVLSVLLDGAHLASAARLAGGFRNIGRHLIADNIINDSWVGTNALFMTANATCTTIAGNSLQQNIVQGCGNTNVT